MTDSRAAATNANVLLTPPASARAAQANANVLLTPPASALVAEWHIQVLMPIAQTATNVAATQLDVLLEEVWAVSAHDGMTAIQTLHTDGRWRPLYLRR